ncbi:MAG: tRNA pseudouridine(55) synthase TruB [Malacoplasma sp.]|nr:tRNA pseudouridine(55) synthase TruB [Malacoplasma sp.]
MCIKYKKYTNILSVDKNLLLRKQVFGVYKPIGWTSNDIVVYLKRWFKFNKIGHGGTLDPLAEGVLVIGVEEGTKKLNNYINHHKEYEFTMQLGIKTASYDMSTPVIEEKKFNEYISDKTIKQVIKDYFTGEYYQTPPAYSAKKVNGVRSYKLAHQNQDVELKKCLVKINKFKVLDVKSASGLVTIKVDVSKGFYIRSFAYDLGLKLNTYATVVKLKRTKVDKFKLNNCYKFKKRETI